MAPQKNSTAALDKRSNNRFSRILQKIFGWAVQFSTERRARQEDVQTKSTGNVIDPLDMGIREHILKMLHPICPFVTEEIWSQLPGTRGTIMPEPFPVDQPLWENAEEEQSMQLLMEVITAVRTIRSEADVHPSAKVHVILICPDVGKRELLRSFSGS